MGCAPSRQKEQESGGISSPEPAPNTNIPKQNGVPSKTKTASKDSNGSLNKIKTIGNAIEAPDSRSRSKKLTILHFNDVYNIEPRNTEPVGGAARFAHKMASYKHLNPFIVFSGDVLNPSMISTVTRGKHMIPVLNALGINIAVYGNHDFDFGVDDLIEFNESTNFPWLMSNVIDNISKDTLADGEKSKIIEWEGIKIGCIGLVEQEWLVTLATVDPSEVTYLDFSQEGAKLAQHLRDQGADFVIALTHMRVPNDCRLAETTPGIDLILGGHDHHYEVLKVNGVNIVKSGSDFRQFSHITVEFNEENNYSIEIERLDITSEIPEDPGMKRIVDEYMDLMKESMEEKIGDVEVELDGRFASLRTKETNLGNFVADIMHNVTRADVVIVNSGTLRSDALHPPGPFKKKDLVSILPMPDSVVLLELKGAQVIKALENGVSLWPRHEGRFPQVSGIRFAFNPERDVGSRVIEESVQIAGQPIDKEKLYKVCTKAYIAKGKDGYDVLKEGKFLLDEESGPILPTIVENHFNSISIVKGAKLSRSRHRQSIVMRLEGASLASLLDSERKHVKISPQVEGRITIITDEDKIDSLFKVSPETPEPEAADQKQDTEDIKLETTFRSNETETTNDMAEKTKDFETSSQHEDHTIEPETSNPGIASCTKESTTRSGESKVDKPDLATEDEYWDLWEAIKTDDIDTVKSLHQEKHIRLTRFQDNKTILHLGAERNSAKVVEYLLLYGKVDPNSLDEILQGVPLHGAAEYGSVDAAEILLRHGAEIDKQDLLGNTALHTACEHNQDEFKKFLVTHGASTTIENTEGEKPKL
ncbi:mannosylglucosyl-3-phosphoglycerate phosphatase [Nematostella vectensis]|uniref:mannosylglucosyl-3-phosphoglycerate phosphatase n=1 Tax=Nematostella vectensis TaxID=45351 RepID=UPI002076E1F8|nr:mannosylglucosyl-3-phosphoglycerate phosphatase [Nematostella vectensis]